MKHFLKLLAIKRLGTRWAKYPFKPVPMHVASHEGSGRGHIHGRGRSAWASLRAAQTSQSPLVCGRGLARSYRSRCALRDGVKRVKGKLRRPRHSREPLRDEMGSRRDPPQPVNATWQYGLLFLVVVCLLLFLFVWLFCCCLFMCLHDSMNVCMCAYRHAWDGWLAGRTDGRTCARARARMPRDSRLYRRSPDPSGTPIHRIGSDRSAINKQLNKYMYRYIGVPIGSDPSRTPIYK